MSLFFKFSILIEMLSFTVYTGYMASGYQTKNHDSLYVFVNQNRLRHRKSVLLLQVLTCLLLPALWCREEAGGQQLIRSRRQQQPRRFENFPARAQAVDRFNREAFIGMNITTTTFYGQRIEKFMHFQLFT